MRLSSSEDRMIVAWVVLTWYRTVTDGRTDGQTEAITANTALCMWFAYSKLCWRAVKMHEYHTVSSRKQCNLHCTGKNW